MLIQIDVTPGAIAGLLRASFVKAGANFARKKSSGRPHIARIAAVTGLSRQEVKRLVDAKFASDAVTADEDSRVIRVVRAWVESPRYGKGKTAPKLKLSGSFPSFESLCKEYAGDIPHMAIVAELKGRQSVRLLKVRGKTFITLQQRGELQTREVMERLAFAANLLMSMARGDRVLVQKMQHVSIPHSLATPYFENSVAERVSALVQQLQIDPSRSSRRKSQSDGLDVFALVSRRTGTSDEVGS